MPAKTSSPDILAVVEAIRQHAAPPAVLKSPSTFVVIGAAAAGLDLCRPLVEAFPEDAWLLSHAWSVESARTAVLPGSGAGADPARTTVAAQCAGSQLVEFWTPAPRVTAIGTRGLVAVARCSFPHTSCWLVVAAGCKGETTSDRAAAASAVVEVIQRRAAARLDRMPPATAKTIAAHIQSPVLLLAEGAAAPDLA